MYGPWSDHVIDYWLHKDDDNNLFLKYEDLHAVCMLFHDYVGLHNTEVIR
jgi:hypothetical protein